MKFEYIFDDFSREIVDMSFRPDFPHFISVLVEELGNREKVSQHLLPVIVINASWPFIDTLSLKTDDVGDKLKIA